VLTVTGTATVTPTDPSDPTGEELDGDEFRASDPDLDVGLGVASVARRLGIAPGTLRTWDRRYGVGPTSHVSGSHRRYSAADLARLTLMRRLMLEGVSPAQAADAALGTDVQALAGMTPLPLDLELGLPRASKWARSGGGHVVPLGAATPAARGLARAAMALDSAACAGVISSSLARRGVLSTWDEILVPVLHGVGERWRTTGAGVEVEHLLSECIEDGLRAVTRSLTRPRNARPVLLAALEPEQHRIPLHAMAAALAERHISVRMLGPRLPVAALSTAVARTGAAVVFLWAQGTDRSSRRATVATLPTMRPGHALLLGGPGWLGHPRLPADAQILKDLPSAVDAVTAALGVDGTSPR
jgi:hypothetical protein